MTPAANGFVGPLAGDFAAFETLKKATGGQHIPLLRAVRRFDRYLADHHEGMVTVTKDVLRSWFATFDHLKPATQRRYRCSTFQICKFLRRQNSATAVREDLEPTRFPRTFRPHIFSQDDVIRLLAAARALKAWPSEPLRPNSMELVVVLLYTCGLRIGEVVRLRLSDYDCQNASLVIRGAKFYKSRIVALSASAQRVLDGYLARRRELGLSCEPEDPLRCCVRDSTPSLGAVQNGLYRLMRRCGLKLLCGRGGPRVHDLRATFAVHRVHQWYRSGQDVQQLLPRLVTYMGHRGLESTQVYLALTPAVLGEASTRFAKFVATPEREGARQ